MGVRGGLEDVAGVVLPVSVSVLPGWEENEEEEVVGWRGLLLPPSLIRHSCRQGKHTGRFCLDFAHAAQRSYVTMQATRSQLAPQRFQQVSTSASAPAACPAAPHSSLRAASQVHNPMALLVAPGVLVAGAPALLLLP